MEIILNHKYSKIEYTLEEYAFQLNKALEGDLKATEKIVEMTSPLIKSSIKKYYKNYSSGNIPYEDLLQDGYLIVLQCLSDYDRKRKYPFWDMLRRG